MSNLKQTAIMRENKQTGHKTQVASYVMVNERVRAFRTLSQYKGWGLVTEERPGNNPDHVKFYTTITNEEGRVIATGSAEEFRGNNPGVNKFSAVMNAETSSVGRALGFAGIGIDGGIASAEEVELNAEKVFDFVIAGLDSGNIDYAKARLADTQFTTEQRRAVLAKIASAKVGNTNTNTKK